MAHLQTIRLFPAMTALENVMSGRHCRAGGRGGRRFPAGSQRARNRRSGEAARHLIYEHLALPQRLAKNLAHGDRRRVDREALRLIPNY
jgi:ABC-type branched-subunit amino acid transport system ATPase component